MLWPFSFLPAVTKRSGFPCQSSIDAKVAFASRDGIGVAAEVVVGKLLQPFHQQCLASNWRQW
jgi:hypothetical protein